MPSSELGWKWQDKKTMKRQTTCLEVTEAGGVEHIADKSRVWKARWRTLELAESLPFGTRHRKRRPLQCCPWLHRRRPWRSATQLPSSWVIYAKKISRPGQKTSWWELHSMSYRPYIATPRFKKKAFRVELQSTPEPSSPRKTENMLPQCLKFIPQKLINDFTVYFKVLLLFKKACCTNAWSRPT